MNVMKWYLELLSDGSRRSTHSASPHTAGTGSSWTLRLCLGTLLGQHAQEISRSAKNAMDQDGVVLHFVEDQQTGFDVIEYFSRGPFYS